MEYRKISGKKHYVYDDIDEFLEHHPEGEVKKDWRLASEGDWVWSDDDRIVQLLRSRKKVSHPGDTKNYTYANGWVRTVVGSFINKPDVIMDTDFSEHASRYTFSKTIEKPANRVRERENVTKKEKEFVTSVIVGTGAMQAYKNVYSEQSDNKARKKAGILLKQERIMKEIEKSVLDVAKELGIDHEYILNKLKHLADYSDDDSIMLSSTKELGKAIGTLGNMVKHKEIGLLGMFSGFSQKELEGVKREQKQLESNG
tara:strand:- start:339 stop:1109 length:771 start_codon:yes stop_codon:yes gene_type:complete